jgi:hypothetical protein
MLGVSQNGRSSRAPADPAQLTVGFVRRVCASRFVPSYCSRPTGRRIPHKLKSGSFGASDVAAHARKCLPPAGYCSEVRSNRQASTKVGRLVECASERAAPNEIMPDEFGRCPPIEHLAVIGENDCSAWIDSPFSNGCCVSGNPAASRPGKR